MLHYVTLHKYENNLKSLQFSNILSYSSIKKSSLAKAKSMCVQMSHFDSMNVNNGEFSM